MLEAMLRAGGYRTGLYTSPHLVRYNERVRIDGREVGDAELLAAFDAVESARVAASTAPLTYFEFGTLAALWLFARAAPDALVLEVGLGGRLDAVNVVDADVAVVTSVDLDHMDYLGPTRDDIGREKAGIFRAGRPAVCGDRDRRRRRWSNTRSAIGADLLLLGRDFDYVAEGHAVAVPRPAAARATACPARRCAESKQLANAADRAGRAGRPARPPAAVRAGRARRPGRRRAARPLPGAAGPPAVVLDVAHNPQAAARRWRATLATMGFFRATAPCSACWPTRTSTASIDAICAARRPLVRGDAARPARRDAPTRCARRWSPPASTPAAIRAYDDVAAAYAAAREGAGEADRIVVFGSFLTVGRGARRAEAQAPRPIHAMARPVPTLPTTSPSTNSKRKARRRLRRCRRAGAGRRGAACRCCSKRSRGRSATKCRCRFPPSTTGRFVSKLPGARRRTRATAKADAAKAEPKADAAKAAPGAVADAAKPGPPPARRRQRSRLRRPPSAAPDRARPWPRRPGSRWPTPSSEVRRRPAGPLRARRPTARPPTPVAAAARATLDTGGAGRQGRRPREPATRRSRRRRSPRRSPRSRSPEGDGSGRQPEGFVVQLAAFADDKGANALADRLKKSGYAAYIEPVQTTRGTLWRVRVGGYATREAADAGARQAEGEGQSGIVAPARDASPARRTRAAPRRSPGRSSLPRLPLVRR